MIGDPTVTVVVVTWNSARLIPDLLAGLPAALEGVGTYEVIVADNGSTDETLAVVLRSAPGVKTVQLGRNAGYAAGFNTAAAVARSSGAVLLVNPDVRLAPGSVTRLIDALAVPGTGIAAPRLVGADGGLLRSLRREPTVLRALGQGLLGGRWSGRFPLLSEVISDPARYTVPGTADWATGAALLIARPCLERVGPWDESFFLYSEETDFALRARDAGFVLRYVPDAVAVHLGGDSHRSPRLWSTLTINRVRLFASRHGRVRSAIFWAALVLSEGLRALARRSPVHKAAFLALLGTWRRPGQVAG